MQLIYRGVSYNFVPASVATESVTVEHTEALKSAFNLIYRGVSYAVDPNVQPAPRFVTTIANLIYRGVTYALNGGVPAPVWAKVPSAAKTGRVDRANRVQLAAIAHRNSIYQNLQHRIKVAQEHGDQSLVQILERELKQSA